MHDLIRGICVSHLRACYCHLLLLMTSPRSQILELASDVLTLCQWRFLGLILTLVTDRFSLICVLCGDCKEGC